MARYAFHLSIKVIPFSLVLTAYITENSDIVITKCSFAIRLSQNGKNDVSAYKNVILEHINIVQEVLYNGRTIS